MELPFILSQAEATLSSMVQRGQELAARLRALQLDRREIACLKFLFLFNPSESSARLCFIAVINVQIVLNKKSSGKKKRKEMLSS